MSSCRAFFTFCCRFFEIFHVIQHFSISLIIVSCILKYKETSGATLKKMGRFLISVTSLIETLSLYISEKSTLTERMRDINSQEIVNGCTYP